MDVLEQYGGFALIVIGLALIWLPIAMIVAGLLLAVHGTLRELNRKDDDGTRTADSVDDSARHTTT